MWNVEEVSEKNTYIFVHQASSVGNGWKLFDRSSIDAGKIENSPGPRIVRQHVRKFTRLHSKSEESQVSFAPQESAKNSANGNNNTEKLDRVIA